LRYLASFGGGLVALSEVKVVTDDEVVKLSLQIVQLVRVSNLCRYVLARLNHLQKQNEMSTKLEDEGVKDTVLEPSGSVDYDNKTYEEGERERTCGKLMSSPPPSLTSPVAYPNNYQQW